MSESGGAMSWNTTEPCQFCRHFHTYAVCEVCACAHHRSPVGFDLIPVQCSAPTQIMERCLFLGDYNNVFWMDLRSSLGITRTLNMSSPCETVFQGELASGIEKIEQCEREGQSVFVYCMTGINRSPAIVIGFLMKKMRWTLEQSYQYVKQRRPSVDLERMTYECLIWHEQDLFGTNFYPPLPPPPAATSNFPNAGGILSPTFSIRSSSSNPGGSALTEASSTANQENLNASTYSFGNDEGVPAPAFSGGSSNSSPNELITGTGHTTEESTPNSSPPKELITGTGDTTEESTPDSSPPKELISGAGQATTEASSTVDKPIR